MVKEIEILNKFMRMIDTNPDKAYYGYNHVLQANEQLAIHSLLVTDGLFRNPDVKIRKQYVSLVESVRENGGDVYVFSTLHVSGIQLQQVSGVAAILRFPLPDIIDEHDLFEDSDDEEDDLQQQREYQAAEAMNRVEEDMIDMGF